MMRQTILPPLHLRLDDCFDFALDDSPPDFFSDSFKTNAEEDLTDILDDSNFSADMDGLFEDVSPIEYASTCFDSIQEKSQPLPSIVKQEMQQVQIVKTKLSHGYNCVRAKSRRRNSQSHSSVQKVEVGKVEKVNPAPYDHEKYQKMKRVISSDLDVLMEANNSSAPSSRRRSNKSSNKRSRRTSRPQCSTVMDSAPMFPLKKRRVTLESAAAPGLSQLFGHRYSLDGNGMMTQQDHQKALQKLADSMKRSELSRRQLAMQRTFPAMQRNVSASTEVQQRIHNLAQQQYPPVASSNNNGWNNCNNNNNYPRSISNNSLNMIVDQQQQHHPISPNPNNDRSSVMQAFFSGSRSTLTNGLEQSRMQLKMLADRHPSVFQ